MRDHSLAISRRELLIAGTALLGGVFAGPARAEAPAERLEAALASSEFVYVCPLRSDGRESTCHGEVWYGWLDDGVVLITSSTSWKARALARGLDTARIWVGNHGRWKGLLFENDAFRQAPHFDARARIVRERSLLDRLLASYETKYPAEIDAWRDRMREGFLDGSRVLIRYSAV